MKTILVDAVYTFVSEDGVIYEDLHRLLETYPNKKLVLTNASEDKFQQYGLDKIPYEFFTLSHNPEKTDPSFFKVLLSKYNLTPSEVVYFEHNIDAVKSAESVGIVSHHFDENLRDLDALKKFLDTNL